MKLTFLLLLMVGLPCQDAPLRLSWTPEVRSPTLTSADTPWLLRIDNASGESVQIRSWQVWTPPEVRVHGLPPSLELPPGQQVQVPLLIEVEPDRPCGPFELRIVANGGSATVGSLRQEFHSAVGNEFLRLDFEPDRSRRRASRPWPQVAGAMTAQNQNTGAIGAGSVLLNSHDGSGHYLLYECADRDLGIDSDRFPYLILHLRSTKALAMSLLVDGREWRMSIGEAANQENAEANAERLPPQALALDGAWHRLAIAWDQGLDGKVGAKSHRIQRVSLHAPADTEFGVDACVVARQADASAKEQLFDWTQRWVAGSYDLDRKQLEAIDPDSLDAQDLVDRELLLHCLGWRHADQTLAKVAPGEPVGEARFAAMLRWREHVDRSPDQLLALGWQQVKAHQELLQQQAQRIAPGATWRQIVEQLRDAHPTAEELPKVAEQAMQAALQFTLEQGFVTVPQAARHSVIDVVKDGELSRTYPFGGYGGSRPSPYGYTGTYFVSPPAVWMNEQEAELRLRGNHHAWTRVVALHELVPGHHLQTVVHQMRPLSAFRRSFHSNVFGEGWALYCEELMYARGFLGEPKLRFTQLHMRLWRAVRIVADVELQCRRKTRQEVEDLLVTEAGLDATNAKAEVSRYLNMPAQPFTYLYGYLQIEQLAADMKARAGAKFSVAEFHDRLLSFGNVPIPAIRKAMLR